MNREIRQNNDIIHILRVYGDDTQKIHKFPGCVVCTVCLCCRKSTISISEHRKRFLTYYINQHEYPFQRIFFSDRSIVSRFVCPVFSVLLVFSFHSLKSVPKIFRHRVNSDVGCLAVIVYEYIVVLIV